LKDKSFQKSFDYAIQGIINTLRTQRNMRIHFLIAFIVLTACFFLDISRIELLLVFLVIIFVLVLEMINTAVEIIVDMIAEEYNFKAKHAKNTAAGAVLLGVLSAVVTGYLIFIDDIQNFSLRYLVTFRNQPLHLIFINLAILLLIIIFLKSFYKKGTPLEGGMPSGHSALAFSILTMVAYLSSSFLVFSLVLLLALVVAHSRIESGIHSFLEVFLGALLGVLLTVLLFGIL